MSRASELIAEIRNELNMLKKDYILYLAGTLKHEPLQKREYLEKRLHLLGNATKTKASELFIADNVIAQVQSAFRQWDKQLERKGKRIEKKIKSQRDIPDQPQAAADRPATRAGSVRIQDAMSQRDEVVKLYDQYISLMLGTGSTKHIGFGRFQTFIQNQTEKFINKGARAVEFEIKENAGKVIIKSKSS